MKTVYYIVGPTCSGKTTIANRLAKRMELPLYHADLAYNMLKNEYKIPVPPQRLLNFRNWNADPTEFGITSWGEFGTMQEAKTSIFEKMITEKNGDFIIEGFTLSFPSERDLVENIIGDHRPVILRIDLPYEKWYEQHEKKMGAEPKDRISSYSFLRSRFEARDHETVYTFHDLKSIDVHYSNYQRPGFTDKKIEALRIPIEPGDVVNDIGCNAGEIGKWCLDRGAKLVRGYDTNWRFLDRALQKGLEPYLGNVETVPLLPADMTLCVSVFHYFRNPQDFLAKARASTRRLFVLELPIFEAGGFVSAYMPKRRATKYSTKLIELWLQEHFREIKCIGESVPPDNSYRLVYHCRV